jgi:hypothetical protein
LDLLGPPSLTGKVLAAVQERGGSTTQNLSNPGIPTRLSAFVPLCEPFPISDLTLIHFDRPDFGYPPHQLLYQSHHYFSISAPRQPLVLEWFDITTILSPSKGLSKRFSPFRFSHWFFDILILCVSAGRATEQRAF